MFSRFLVIRLAATAVIGAALGASACVHAAPAPDSAAVRALFLQQVDAENAHDLARLDAVLADSPDDASSPVSFVARAYEFWGKRAVMAHLVETFKGTWHLDPDMSRSRIVALSDDTMQIYVPTRVTLGAPGKAATTASYLINQFAVRTAQGWRFTAILPVPAQ